MLTCRAAMCACGCRTSPQPRSVAAITSSPCVIGLGGLSRRQSCTYFGLFSGTKLASRQHRLPGLQRQAPLPPAAALWTLPADLTSALHTGIAVSVLLGVCFSTLPILTGDSKERNERRFDQPTAAEGEENLRWAVMSGVALFPFLNPLAWVFAALDDEEASALYWTFALLYSLPYLAAGMELDGFALAVLAAGAVHVQAERIAQTEPAEVELPQVVRTLLRSLPGAAAAAGRYGALVGGEVAERARRAGEAAQRRPDRKYLEERRREAGMELDEFDRKQRQRLREQQGRGGEKR